MPFRASYHTFMCEMDLALTYSMRRPKMARECAHKALTEALKLGNPSLAFKANTLLGVL